MSFLIAFGGGLVSFLSPCVFPLIPSYITFLTGLSLEDAQQAPRTALTHAVLFVSGFTIVFLAMGAGATAIGALLLQHREWISRVGGVLLIVFGLYLLGVFNIAALSRERRLHLADKPMGYLGSVFVGIAFGAGWTPCIGPILSGILGLAALSETFNEGMLLLFTYSMGLAIPFLLAAVLLQRFLSLFSRIKRTMVWVTRISGALLIITGLLMVANQYTRLASFMNSLTPKFLFNLL